MKVLVTGAGGFLGREVVLALRRRGHLVRALDLPRGAVRSAPAPGVEEVHADVCAADLAPACEGVDAVVHLAAQLSGDAERVVGTAVEGTRRILEAMERTGVRRLVLASSLSVYDWSGSAPPAGEASPLEPHPEERDAYTVAKCRQEVQAREGCRRAGVVLTVLRPGLLWGAGRDHPATLGQRLGPLHLVVAPSRSLPVAHVENAADAFAVALERAGEGTFDVVDHPEVTAGRFLRDQLRRASRRGLVVPVPYGAARAALGLLHRLAPARLRERLPSFVAPARLAARYRPARIDAARFRAATGWRPPLGWEECLERTHGPARSG